MFILNNYLFKTINLIDTLFLQNDILHIMYIIKNIQFIKHQ